MDWYAVLPPSPPPPPSPFPLFLLLWAVPHATVPHSMSLCLFVSHICNAKQTAKDIAHAMSTKAMGMRQFLRVHLPGAKGHTTQLALYLQGMRLLKASQRQDVSFSDPDHIIDETVEAQLKMVEQRQLILARADANRNARAQRRLEEALPYANYHTIAKTFTAEEVGWVGFVSCKRIGGGRWLLEGVFVDALPPHRGRFES